MNEDRFELISVGDEAEIFHTIVEEDLDAFAKLTGDNNPLHMDDSYAATTSLKKRVVHGMLTASFISAMIGTKLPGRGALWYEQHLRFLRPVRIGDRIKIWAKVKHKSLSQRILTLETVVFCADGSRVIEGEAKVKVIKPEEKGVSNMIEKKGAVIVTGASRGIGAAIAKSLALDGYPVIVNFLGNADLARKVVDEIIASNGKAIEFQSDVCDGESVKKMVDCAIREFEAITGVVNNASPPIKSIGFSQLSWDDIQQHIDVQIKGSFNLCQAVLPYLVEQQRGSIVNISSIVSDNVPPAKWLPYTIAKAAVAAFSRALAVEYGPKGIRVNSVSPGMTDTDLISDVPEKVKMVTKMQTPLRKLATPEDIANVVSFLFSDKASHIAGENIRVCGGITMR